MGWLPIVICLAVVALIVGPIMLMQPTPAQRRELNLRNTALKSGLRVHFQPMPEGCDHPPRQKQAIAYCLPWRDQEDLKNVWVLIKKKFDHDLHALGYWDWASKPLTFPEHYCQTLELQVASLPKSVYAVASGPQGLCCYWSEQGKEGDVVDLAKWLTDTADKISIA